MKTVRIIDQATNEVVKTIEGMSEEGIDGLYRKINFEQYRIEEGETDG